MNGACVAESVPAYFCKRDQKQKISAFEVCAAMARFRSTSTLQKLVEIYNHIKQEQHAYNWQTYKLNRTTALTGRQQFVV